MFDPDEIFDKLSELMTGKSLLQFDSDLKEYLNGLLKTLKLKSSTMNEEDGCDAKDKKRKSNGTKMKKTVSQKQSVQYLGSGTESTPGKLAKVELFDLIASLHSTLGRKSLFSSSDESDSTYYLVPIIECVDHPLINSIDLTLRENIQVVIPTQGQTQTKIKMFNEKK